MIAEARRTVSCSALKIHALGGAPSFILAAVDFGTQIKEMADRVPRR